MSNKVSTMVKKVNVIAPIPIRTVNPPLYGKKEGLMMTPANILKCLIGRATVYEVLSDGSKIRLTTSNYNKENKPVTKPAPIKRNKPVELEKNPGPVVDNSTKKKTIVIRDEIATKDTAKIEENLDTLKNTKGEEIKVPEVKIEEVKVEAIETAEEIIVDEKAEEVTVTTTSEEEDPELAMIAAEIAKMEAEEAAKKAKNEISEEY